MSTTATMVSTDNSVDARDLAWEVASATTVDDLNLLGGMDDWLREVGSVDRGDAYWDQWSFWMFWINDVRYANRKNTGNDRTVGDSQVTRNARETRTVAETVPQLVGKGEPFHTPGSTDVKGYNNDTPQEQVQEIKVTETSGQKITIDVSHKSEFSVSASVTVGGFGVNASGSLTDEQSSHTTKDTSQSTETSHTIRIPAHKQVQVTTTTSTTTQADVYQVPISLRGKNGQATLNFPQTGGHFPAPFGLPNQFGKCRNSYDSIGKWINLKDLPNFGPRMSQPSVFTITTVTHITQISFDEKPATPEPTGAPSSDASEPASSS